jgi:predicted HTH transcriptional regulator
MDIRYLLRRHEGKTLEFKRDLSSPLGVLRTLVAFANSSGGVLLLGVEDDRSVRGIPDALAQEERLASLVSDGIEPKLMPTIEIAAWRRVQLLAVEVFPSAQRPHWVRADGMPKGAYVRVGSTNRSPDAGLLAEMRREAGNEVYDETPLSDMNSEALDFRVASELFRARRVLKVADLRAVRALVRHQNRDVPSVGGLLLFGRDPQARFPDAWLQCGRFEGTTKARIIDRSEVRATLPTMLEGALAFVRKHALLGMEIEGLRRKDRWSVPMDAVREALVNAVVHADYSMTGRPLRLAIYDDRLEVENPGLLPAGMTVEDMVQGVSRLRNRVIGRVFAELGLIEQWGSGVPRMFDSCRESGVGAPRLSEVAFGFQVVLPLSQVRDSSHEISGTDARILGLLAENRDGLSTQSLAECLDMSGRAVRLRMAGLLAQGKVFVLGKGPRDPRRRYVLHETGGARNGE